MSVLSHPQLPRVAVLAMGFEARSHLELPLVLARVPAGFPSAAEDYVEQSLDLNEFLVSNPVATYFVRVSGDSMTGAGIFNGDILVVDRSVEPRSGHVVVAALDGEMTVKRLRLHAGRVWLCPENPSYKPIAVAEGRDFAVWGVVQHVLHKV